MLTLALVLAALQQPAATPPPTPAPALPPQVGDTSPFRRLALPTPTLLREGSGRAGPRYWQQRADYTIRASLDTATHVITGSETIRYSNNPPHTRTYPRLAVYDDVRGWNTEQYLGQGEFYLEYGDFDVTITVPRSFVVAATGTLLNPLEVLTPTERARLAQALKSDTTVAVIAKTEVGQAFTRPVGGTPTRTWHYSAKSVRDVAWAAAPNFIWDASGYNGVLIQSLYPPEANAGWARSTEYARHSIKHYSEK